MCNPDGSPRGFNPEGRGYDYDSARRAGLGPDGTGENAGHWGSVAPASPGDQMPIGSYLMLKGHRHPTWNHGMEGELERGSEIQNKGGRYWSVPKGR